MLKDYTGKLFLLLALGMLVVGLLLGVLAAQSYIIPGIWKDTLSFSQLRPMHVSAAVFWILSGAIGAVYCALSSITRQKLSPLVSNLHLVVWIIAIAGVFYAYITGKFGGREYWEFDPVFALPIACAWLIFLIQFVRMVKNIRQWPVYIWMWMTGIVFFLFTFTENYLWIFPYFRAHFITDMTIQWKVNGSLVGSWNQMIYGVAFFLMERISGDPKPAFSRTAFIMYFLGLFNLMFNWGHHIYSLPTQAYVRYIGYAVSMTEWIFLARILYNWKQSLSDMQKHYSKFSYRFIMAADIWVFINMGQAILMSIPALNLYTHGTHVTVAHAMGTTIGINTMILLGACSVFLADTCYVNSARHQKWMNIFFWCAQGSLLIFWLSLNVIGIQKGLLQLHHPEVSFHRMMQSLSGLFMLFTYAGSLLMLSIGSLAYMIAYSFLSCKIKKQVKRNIVSPSHTKISFT